MLIILVGFVTINGYFWDKSKNLVKKTNKSRFRQKFARKKKKKRCPFKQSVPLPIKDI